MPYKDERRRGKIYTHFSKEEVFRTMPDGWQGNFCREIQIFSVATAVNVRKTMEYWTENTTGPARFWRQIQIPSK
jgi:hypothetical protein